MPQLQRLSLKAQVYEIIRQKILQQEYALGEKINIDTVADELKILSLIHIFSKCTLRSSTVNKECLLGFSKTATTRQSKSLDARSMMSKCPSVTGSKLPA